MLSICSVYAQYMLASMAAQFRLTCVGTDTSARCRQCGGGECDVLDMSCGCCPELSSADGVAVLCEHCA
jgi:hypothetical protein